MVFDERSARDYLLRVLEDIAFPSALAGYYLLLVFTVYTY